MTTTDPSGRPVAFVSPRSGLVGAAFVLAAAAGWVAAGYDLAELRTLAEVHSGRALLPADRDALSRAGRLAGSMQLASAALVALLLLPWLYRARVNLHALGARRLCFRREWAVLAFLVPGVNTFRPCQVVSEVWRASDPTSGDPLAWRSIRTPALVVAWWLAFVAWVALELLSALLLGVGLGSAPMRLAFGIALAADVSAAAAASLGYFVVARISAAQDQKWSAFGGGDAAETAVASFTRKIASGPA